jgi:hypothetical protein
MEGVQALDEVGYAGAGEFPTFYSSFDFMLRIQTGL